MTRRELPPTTRIFRRKKPGWSLFSALVLGLALGVTGFGLITAIYLERAPPRSPPQPAGLANLPAPDRAPVTPHDPLAAAMPLPATEPPQTVKLTNLEPEAGAKAAEPTDPPVPAAALEAPPPAVPPVAPVIAVTPAPPPVAAESRSRYWVEYGVYAGKHQARRLQQALARDGLEAAIVKTHRPDGRPLLRVRSSAVADLAAARAAAQAAQRSLRIGALIHRQTPAAAAPEKRYLVQFGAFAKPQPAARLQRKLAQNGVGAIVSSMIGMGSKHLFLVRSSLVNHAQAVALAERGRRVAELRIRIDEVRTGPPVHRHAQHPPPRRLAHLR